MPELPLKNKEQSQTYSTMNLAHIIKDFSTT